MRPAALGLVGLDPLYLLLRDPVRIVDEALAVGQGQHLAAKLQNLLGRVGGDVAGAGDDRRLALDEVPTWVSMFWQEVDGAIAGRLRADQRAAIFQGPCRSARR
jgi:hypothetical protein